MLEIYSNIQSLIDKYNVIFKLQNSYEKVQCNIFKEKNSNINNKSDICTKQFIQVIKNNIIKFSIILTDNTCEIRIYYKRFKSLNRLIKEVYKLKDDNINTNIICKFNYNDKIVNINDIGFDEFKQYTKYINYICLTNFHELDKYIIQLTKNLTMKLLK